MMYFHKTAGQFHQPLQHIQHLIFPMFGDTTDNIEETTSSKIYTRNIQINCYNSQNFKVEGESKGSVEKTGHQR